jgi:hypothetical protein
MWGISGYEDIVLCRKQPECAKLCLNYKNFGTVLSFNESSLKNIPRGYATRGHDFSHSNNTSNLYIVTFAHTGVVR